MFTGIIEALGTIRHIRQSAGDQRLTIASGALDLSDVQLGDSIATNGACLTVTALGPQEFSADVSVETLRHTTLGKLGIGAAVNLEKAMAANGRFGGHMVSGHVDGVGEVVSRENVGRAMLLRVRCPDELTKYIARKGSITVDGVSLTVNAIDGSEFDLMIIPHSQAKTILPQYRVGTSVNLEVDLVARYLERLLPGESAITGGDSSITPAFLAQHGFMRR